MFPEKEKKKKKEKLEGKAVVKLKDGISLTSSS